MGTYYQYTQSNLIIDHDQIAQAEQLLRDRDTTIVKRGYSSNIDENSSGSILQQVASNNRCGLESIEDGAVRITMPYDEVKNGGCEDWVRSLAPVLREGSFIEMSNDNCDSPYRYMFSGGKCYYVHPTWQIPPDAIADGEDE